MRGLGYPDTQRDVKSRLRASQSLSEPHSAPS